MLVDMRDRKIGCIRHIQSLSEHYVIFATRDNPQERLKQWDLARLSSPKGLL